MTRNVTDPYAVLGVPPNASAEQVARAFRRLAKRHHPDLHPDAVAAAAAAGRMRRLNEAWRILSNPVRRARYDASRWTGGAAAPHWAGSRPAVQPAAPSQAPRWRRPEPPATVPRSFGDSAWAALLVGGVWLLLLTAAIYAGS